MSNYQGDLILDQHISEDPEVILEGRLEHLKLYLSFAMQSLRKNLQKNQAEMAKILGVKQSAISKLENPYKQHDFETVMRYLHALDAELVVGIKSKDSFQQVSDDIDTVIVDVPAHIREKAKAQDQDIREFVHHGWQEYIWTEENLEYESEFKTIRLEISDFYWDDPLNTSDSEATWAI
ncbi:helix-turn-helix domain-containing protein [Deinococcus roseus]|uniref:HTH cro/C1-type domain-containing protein n=1 Tax=Deinococcus roseus TaxID=392414 RepID=A0ABQ2DF15_9DEIO|nr:helix-turn-helix transcriptional regulator [Deinococcus roseus]GGJ55119.1 hypothetical protein GCM10008938_46550 [Deinococcus roseus]